VRFLGLAGAVLATGLAATLPVLAASPPAGCRPTAGLGSIVLHHGATDIVVDLTTCGRRVVPAKLALRAGITSPDGRLVATVRLTGRGVGKRDTIWIVPRGKKRGRPIFSALTEGNTTGVCSPGPIWLLGWSGDSRWLVFTIDSGGSSSIAADGLIPRVVSVRGGRDFLLPIMLTNEDYLAWCDGRLVFTAGEDRIATDRKRLMVASRPGWRPRLLVRSPGRSWGSLACAPHGHAVVAQAQPQSVDADAYATRWALGRVGLDGSTRRLTTPPPGYADESPRFSRDGRTLLFVRSRRGRGALYALRGGRLIGPILAVGTQPGFYGYRDWWQTMDWSLGPKPGL